MKYISHEGGTLAFSETDKPVLKSHEVLVKVSAITLHQRRQGARDRQRIPKLANRLGV